MDIFKKEKERQFNKRRKLFEGVKWKNYFKNEK